MKLSVSITEKDLDLLRHALRISRADYIAVSRGEEAPAMARRILYARKALGMGSSEEEAIFEPVKVDEGLGWAARDPYAGLNDRI